MAFTVTLCHAVDETTSPTTSQASGSSAIPDSHATIPPSIRLFGQRIAPGMRSPEPQNHFENIDQFPPLHFLPPTHGPTDRLVLEVMARGIVGGETSALPSIYYTRDSLDRLHHWSVHQFRSPSSMFYFYVTIPYEGPSTIFLAKQIPSNEFQRHLFPHVHFDESMLQPFAVFKTQLAQRDFIQNGAMQIVGVELMHIAGSSLDRTPTMGSVPLQQVLHYIERGI
ncbi:hypothetical protein [Sporisorium scitamineum]|nr:hypothetical protein [Sporisorium scitamineum]